MTVCYLLQIALICLFCHASAARDEIGVTREIWLNVNGDSIQNLLADSRFPHRPNFVKFIKDFDIPSDEKKQYVHNAQRIKGFFLAPQNGEYKFYSSCSGSCEIFLGLNGMEGENNRIISQTQPTKHNDFERYPEQVSHTIALEKDKKYYIEAISKETDENSDDNLSVGVELPDGKKMFPISEELLRRSKTTPTGLSNQKTNVIVPKLATKPIKRHTKIVGGVSNRVVSGVHRTLNQAKKSKNNPDTPVVDLEGKRYNDKDAIEPGINIFSEENSDQKNLVDNPENEASGEYDTMKEGDENIEFSFDDKPPSDVSKAGSSDKNSRIIEAHFGNENKSLANILKERVKTSNLKVIMPGGNQLKLTGSSNNKNTKSASVILPSKTIGNSDKTPSVSSSDATDAVTIDVKDSSINKNLTDTVTKNIQSVDFTAKKTKTARVVGKIIRLIGHNRPVRNQNKTTGNTRSVYNGGGGFGGFGGFDGGHGDIGGFGVGGEGPHGDSSMSLGHGSFEGGYEGGPVGLPMGAHGTMPTDSHGAMPEGHGHLMPLHNTGAVAMVPALLHHDRPEYDHDTGEYHGGGTHVEPLVPVHNGGQIVEGPHEGHGEMGHGGGMEHAMGMMHPHGAIDMDHGGGHHIPEIHGDMHHDDYHHHIEPLPVMPAAPVAPAKPAHHKPDIIKVEFVPEEATVEATNKSQISQPSRKAGTVRVQFIPGDLQQTVTSDAVTRHSPSTADNQESSGKRNAEETMTVSTNKGQEKTTLDNVKITVTGEKERPSSGAVSYTSKENDSKNQKSIKPKSKNGYEVNPKLPAEGGTSRDSSSQGVATIGSSSGGGGGGGGGGGPMASFSGGEDYPERIDPPLTSLGQQYVDSLQAEQKAAVAQQKINNGNDDRVYFGSQNTPDPNPTHDSPSDPSVQSEPGYHGPSINPVANHLVEAMNRKTVTPEEALQMMNDFVSGNQDMSKAARNMDGMLGQVAANKERMVESRSGDSAPSHGDFPDSSSVQSQPDETQPHFIDDSSQLNPNLDSGYTDPTFQKESQHEQTFHENSPVNAGLFNEHNEHSTPAFDYQPSQRDQQQEPSMEHMGISNTEHMGIYGNPQTLSKINQMSPNGPPPPVHIFDSEKGSNAPTHEPPPPPQNLVMEPAKSDYDGFANPSFHKSLPQLPMSGPLNSIIDKMDPHENRQDVNEEGSFFSAPNDNTIAQPSENSINMPSSQVMPESQEMNHINTGPQPFAVHQSPSAEFAGAVNPQNNFNNEANNVPSEEASNAEAYSNDQSYSNDQVESPHGRLAPAFPVGETSMGFTDDSSNFARKFQMPQQQHQNKKHQSMTLRKTKLKEEVGNRKHQVIADLYADAIFPEDFSDIESLKGSLQGKTLTNFDKENSQISASKKSLDKVHTEVKASFPLEGSIMEGAALRSKVPKSPKLVERRHRIRVRKSHHKKHINTLNAKSKHVTKRKSKVLKHNAKRSRRSMKISSRKRRSVVNNHGNAIQVPRKSPRYFHHSGVPIKSSNTKANIHRGSAGLHGIRPNMPALKTVNTHYVRNNNTIQGEKLSRMKDDENVNQVSNSMYPQKTDWADIHPIAVGSVSNAEVSKDYENALQRESPNSKDVQRKIIHVENSQIVEHPSAYETPEYQPKPVKTDQAKLRQLVTELKDVLHRLHESNPAAKHQLLTDGSSVNLGSYINDATPDMTQIEAVSKGDILSAFANVGKPQPIRSVDIESYTQDVWEPGLKGFGDSLYGAGVQFKRDKLPELKRKPKN